MTFALGETDVRIPATTRRFAAVTVAAGVFIATLDLSIVNVAFPAIGRSFAGTPLATLSWILNAYAIIYAALLIPAAKLAERYGMKTVFLAGTVLFTLGSGLCALSPDPACLIAARALQALGAAALSPTALGLLIALHPGDRARAMRLFTTAAGLAAACGPMVGGFLVTLDWRWIFLVNLPIGVLTFVHGAKSLATDRPAEPRPLPDLAGSALLITAISLLTLCIINADHWGWTSPAVLGSLTGAALLAALAVRRSAHHRAPILDLGLLRVRSFATANIGTLLYNAAFAAALLTSTLYLQSIWGYSALAAGLAMTPGNLMLPFMPRLSSALTRRIGNPASIVLGLLLMVAGALWWLALIGLHTDYAAAFLPGLLLNRIGIGISLAPLMAENTRDLTPEKTSIGTGIVNTNRQVGFVLGISAAIALIGTPSTMHLALTAYRSSWVFIALTALLAAAVSVAAARQRANRAG
jgi:EmrB/QacA subfamily drug resistance transporter